MFVAVRATQELKLPEAGVTVGGVGTSCLVNIFVPIPEVQAGNAILKFNVVSAPSHFDTNTRVAVDPSLHRYPSEAFEVYGLKSPGHTSFLPKTGGRYAGVTTTTCTGSDATEVQLAFTALTE